METGAAVVVVFTTVVDVETGTDRVLKSELEIEDASTVVFTKTVDETTLLSCFLRLQTPQIATF